tara:strand:- start:13374 stop:14273 length:900 start_codon:yes stop_codon:yes gene_type:complete
MSDSEELGDAYDLYYKGKRYYFVENDDKKTFGVFKYIPNIETEEDLVKEDLGDYGHTIKKATINNMIFSKTLSETPQKKEEKEEEERPATPRPKTPVRKAPKQTESVLMSELEDALSDDDVEKIVREKSLGKKAGLSQSAINKCLNGDSAREILNCLRKKRVSNRLVKAQPVKQKKEIVFKKKQKEPIKSNIKLTVSDKDLSKQPAPPRKSKGERVRAVRSDKGQDHKWSDGREKTKTYKENEDVDWSRVRCREDTCWKTNTRSTDATTANKKSGGQKVYKYNKEKGHYIKQLRRKKKD